MNLDMWLKLANTVVTLGTALVAIYVFLKSKTDKRFEQHFDRMDELERCADEDREQVARAVAERRAHHAEHERRIALVEQRLGGLPTHEDLRKIYEKLNTVQNTVAGQEERSRNTNDAVRRIETHLLEKR